MLYACVCEWVWCVCVHNVLIGDERVLHAFPMDVRNTISYFLYAYVIQREYFIFDLFIGTEPTSGDMLA